MARSDACFSPETGRWQDYIRHRAGETGVDISPAQAALLAVHAGELARWNRRINLTAITDPKETAVKHFLDSLVPFRHIPSGSALLDIGSGGGFPGIPLKVADPSLTVTLVDATRKKVNFLNQVIRLLSLENIQTIHGRAESLNKDITLHHSFETVISRAFSSLDRFVTISHRLVRENGNLIAMKGDKFETELRNLDKLTLSIGEQRFQAADLFSITVEDYRLPSSGDRRALVILNRRPLTGTHHQKRGKS